MSFPRASLTIGKDCAIISFQDILRQLLAGYLKYIILQRVFREDIVKTENLVFPFISIYILDVDLFLIDIRKEKVR